MARAFEKAVFVAIGWGEDGEISREELEARRSGTPETPPPPQSFGLLQCTSHGREAGLRNAAIQLPADMAEIFDGCSPGPRGQSRCFPCSCDAFGPVALALGQFSTLSAVLCRERFPFRGGHREGQRRTWQLCDCFQDASPSPGPLRLHFVEFLACTMHVSQDPSPKASLGLPGFDSDLRPDSLIDERLCHEAPAQSLADIRGKLSLQSSGRPSASSIRTEGLMGNRISVGV